MSLKDAFNSVIKLRERAVTLTRPGTPTNTVYNIRIAPSNYQRKLEGPSETVIKGREFIISKAVLDSVSFSGPPKRGDWINDTDLGKLVITEVSEMYDFSTLMAFRVRTG